MSVAAATADSAWTSPLVLRSQVWAARPIPGGPGYTCPTLCFVVMGGPGYTGPTSSLWSDVESVHVHALPVELARGWVPREEDDDAELDAFAGRLAAEPGAPVRPGDLRLLADALRPDDDAGQVEVDVRERGQQ